ncbi:MAG: hypothetical protein ABIS86_19155, partial [Streptosporangiaceae bacterium]
VQEANAASAAGIRSDVGDLKAQIEDLKTQVANGQAPDFTAIEATADSLVAGAESLAALDAENPEQPPVEPTE